jgi:hypothetical protein
MRFCFPFANRWKYCSAEGWWECVLMGAIMTCQIFRCEASDKISNSDKQEFLICCAMGQLDEPVTFSRFRSRDLDIGTATMPTEIETRSTLRCEDRRRDGRATHPNACKLGFAATDSSSNSNPFCLSFQNQQRYCSAVKCWECVWMGATRTCQFLRYGATNKIFQQPIR